MSSSLLRVFVSSTSDDLNDYRDVAKSTILDQKWHPVMMEHFKTRPERIVEACQEQVAQCDLLLLIIAFRRGWVPLPKQGGNGRWSITVYELDAARKNDIPVRALLARDTWPGKLWDLDHKARDWILKFRQDLNLPAEFFDYEPLAVQSREPLPIFRSKVRQALLDHREALHAQASHQLLSTAVGQRSVGAEIVLPSLEERLGGIILPRMELLRIYQGSAPRDWGPPSTEANPILFLFHCVRHLAKAPRQRKDGTFPLLGFVQRLLQIEHLPPEVSRDLRAWLDTAAAQLAADAVDERRLREGRSARAAPEVSASCHLLVQITPRLRNPARYSVKAWLSSSVQSTCVMAGEEEHARAELPALLAQLRKEVALRRVSLGQVWVAFLLPRNLLCEDVDQWKVILHLDGGVIALPIGSEHRVVVRSLDRARRRKAVTALRSRWDALVQQADTACRMLSSLDACDAGEGLAVWVEGGDVSRSDMCKRLLETEQVVCALLGNPPTPTPTNSRGDVLNVLFDTGVPVVLWTRRAPPDREGQHHEEVHRLLQEGELRNLPDRVWDLRRQALLLDDPNHAGRHLTLLWDDPTIASPDFDAGHQFRPPQRKR